MEGRKILSPRRAFVSFVILPAVLAVIFLSNSGAGICADTTYVGWAVGSNLDGYGTILRTNDSGKTWIQQGMHAPIPDTFLASVATTDNDTCWIVGGRIDGYGTILRTEDGGDTWVRQGSPASIPDTDLLKIYAVDNNTAWVVGPGTILSTVDGGQTWQNRVTADVPNVHLQGVFALDVNNVWATGYVNNNQETVLRTIDGGVSWVNKGGPEQTLPDPLSDYMLDVSAPSNAVAWACGNGFTVIRTIDGGTNWSRSFPSGGRYDSNSIHGFDADNAWVVTDSDGIYRTYDGGLTWPRQEVERTNSYLMCINVLNSNVAWVAGNNVTNGIIHHTTDGGATWQKQYEPEAGVTGISLVEIESQLPYTGR